MIEQYIRYEFPISNNQAEYEALLAGLALAQEVGAKTLETCIDSQVRTECQSRPPVEARQHQTRVGKLIFVPRNGDGTLDIHIGSRLLPDIRAHDLDDPNPQLPRERTIAGGTQRGKNNKEGGHQIRHHLRAAIQKRHRHAIVEVLESISSRLHVKGGP
ncbi:hypothetical protein PIB30_042344 [Stylosanthes scabra]|uniref:RNase H type-1 domain-containing protein n=1 Tax=Stylosanthes scabra TaxID=79078 RepID=A0ABU6SF42_9FABA|nr:hypothetical protein [Stylosanthes scabra]